MLLQINLWVCLGWESSLCVITDQPVGMSLDTQSWVGVKSLCYYRSTCGYVPRHSVLGGSQVFVLLQINLWVCP